MSCPIDKSQFNTALFKELSSRVANNDSTMNLYHSYTVAGVDDNGKLMPTEGFKKYLEDKGITDFSFDDAKFADVVRDYVKHEHLSVEFCDGSFTPTVQNRQAVIANGYTSPDARIDAIRTCVTFGLTYLDATRRILHKKLDGNISQVLRNGILGMLRKEIAVRIANAQNIDISNPRNLSPIMAQIRKEGIKFIKDSLDTNDITNANIIALYTEATNTTKEEDEKYSPADLFFRKVLSNGKFAELKIHANDEFNEEGLKDDASEETDLDDVFFEEGEENPVVDESVDETMKQYDHSGTKPNVMRHVDEAIKTYFYSLYKLTTTEKTNGQWTVSKSRFLGTNETMDASQCACVIYRDADFTNWRKMIDSIKRIAERYRGFEAFAKLAEDLENDTDFCYRFYNNFGKIVFSKAETIVENHNSETKPSNQRSSKRSAMMFDMMNSFRGTCIAMASVDVNGMLNMLQPTKFTYKDLNSSLAKKYISELSRLYGLYFPTIDKYAISSYIANNASVSGNVDVRANYRTLYNFIARVVEASKKSYELYSKKQFAISQLRHKIENAKYDEFYDFAKINKLQKELDAVLGEEYIDRDANGVMSAIAETLAPYAAVSIDLNSRNVYGNLSSDVLNNNMLTNFINMMQSTINALDKTDTPLTHYAEFKFLGRQHDFSNILLEQIGEDGRPINKALFRREKGKIVPTENATELLKVELFSGATSFDTGKNILYSEMSSTDYLTTAFLNFRNTGNTGAGRYFMRIPSDAPKTFVITAPKYSIDGLIEKGAVNVNHPLFQQLRNAFKQDVLNMVVALNEMFLMDENGVLQRDRKTGELIVNPKYAGKNINKLYKIYHYRDGAITKKVNGRDTLTGRVFESTKFTVFSESDDTETNYGKKIIDEAFDFLYGGFGDKLIVRRQAETNAILGIETTPELDEIINKHLSDFVIQYSEEAMSRIQEAKGYILESDSTLKDDNSLKSAVTEFVLNTHLMYINFDEIFEGDSRFYKNSQDFLKRAKEVQGSGTPYGNVDYTRSFLVKDKKKLEGVMLNDEDALKQFAKAVGVSEDVVSKLLEIGQYDAFNAITVENTIRRIVDTGEGSVVEKKLAKEIAAKGLSKEEAEKKARTMLSKFDEVTVNDAQSYITFEEWVRRIAARGQLGKYLPTIVKILDTTQPLSPETIDEFVQVQKNFYYDLHYDESLGIEVPRQIKNAEFVLVPRFIEGTELQQVYDMMKELGIDQLNTEETSKAGKHNVLSLWDNDGKLDIEGFKKSYSSDCLEYYTYNNLYTQQETPQHVNAENKAGIQVMKKILDNIPEGHKLYPYKELFMKLYSAKVYKAFDETMTELNVPRTADGSIVVNSDGSISGLNIELFYDKFREQAERLGMDSKLSDFFTLDPDTLTPLMPNYFNGNSNKIENIAQALFNNSITRQKLPGFHAAQITGVSWNKLGKKGTIGISHDLRYHTDKNGKYAPYIEIMLPKSAFNFAKNEDGSYKFSDEELIKQLEDAGLDKVIGYRIPTEGKQSVCVMKVVAFIDDACGSTIVVPDGWVAQTGSDFDIDSVYGIQHATYIDSDGKIQKIKYEESLSEKDRLSMWRRMVRRVIGKDFVDVWKDKNERIEKAKEKAREHVTKERNKLLAIESTAYNNLSEREQALIRDIHKQQNRGTEKLSATDYAKLLEDEANLLDERNNKSKELRNYIESVRAISSFITGSDLKKEIGSNIRSEIEKLEEESMALYKEYAEARGLKSLDYYLTSDASLLQSEAATNSGIVDCMINILSDDSSIEENLSTSNFEDIKSSMARYLSEDKSRKARSVYNIYDQAAFMGDATSGLKLKGFSVTRDNFCSVCNTVRPYVQNSPIKIAYPKSKYSKEQLDKHFGNVKEKGDYWVVTHDTFGWSKDNKNVDGEIITIYSSETTAHILDAMKVGNVPNVNDYSFGVYKTFVDTGSNYDVAIGFMLQPAVTEIIKAEAKNNSIYTARSHNPIVSTIKALASKIPGLPKFNERTTINSVITALNKNVNVLVTLQKILGDTNLSFAYEKGVFKIKQTTEIGEEDYTIVLNSDELAKRIKEHSTNTPVEEMDVDNIVYDLVIAIEFSQLQNLSQTITKHAQVLNPDKFGAKQTIFGTNKVFADIMTLIKNEAVFVTEDGTHLLQAIYPGVENGVNSFATSPTQKSAYPPLYHFLKYASAPAVVINRNLFDTQNPVFVEAISRIKEIYSSDKVLTEKLYKDFEKHVLGYLYRQIPFIAYPVSAHSSTGELEIIYPDSKDVDSVRAESERIRGYGASSDFNFYVEDFYNPTDEEIEVWAQLTPAQKIAWLQHNLKDAGIFGHIKVDFQNRNRNNAQTIEFSENEVSIEDIYDMFTEAFYNTNPLLRLAAADIIKYAFQVEGYRMTQRAVNKVVSNTPLMGDVLSESTGIVSYMRQRISSNGGSITRAEIDKCIETYVRSKKPTELSRVNLKDKNCPLSQAVVKLETATIAEGWYFSQANQDTYASLVEAGLGFWRDGEFVPVSYFMTTGSEKTIYKVVTSEDAIYAYPLNNLEANEYDVWSANPKNNIYNEPRYFEGRIKGTIAREDRKNYGAPRLVSSKYTNTLNLDEPANEIEAIAFQEFKDSVNEHSDEITTSHPVYFWKRGISRHIARRSRRNGSLQVIDNKVYNVFKRTLPKELRPWLKDGDYERVDVAKLPRTYAAYAQAITDLRAQAINSNLEGDIDCVGVVESPVAPQTIPNYSLMNSDVTESTIHPIETILYDAENDSPASKLVRDRLQKLGVEPTSESIDTSIDEVYQLLHDYVKATYEDIIDKARNFTEDEEGNKKSINSPEAINEIRNDKQKRIAYLKLILDSRKLIDNFQEFKNLPLDDAKLRDHIEAINNYISKLQDSMFNEAWNMFTNEYLAKLSTNPLVQKDIINLLDGYYSSGAVEALINDTQEMPNPLVQIITKEVMTDVRRREMEAQRKVIEFKNTIEQYIKEAKAAGANINWDNIVDKDGRLIQTYTQQFLDDYSALKKKLDDIKQDESLGEGSIEYLQAELELDKWLIDHVERVFKPTEETESGLIKEGYYEKLYKAKKRMVDNHPEIFIAYRKLLSRRKVVRDFITHGSIDPRYEIELDEINKKISALSSEFYFDGEHYVKKEYARNLPLEEKINSYDEAIQLKDYIQRVNAIHEEFTDREENASFRETLERKRQIVEAWEARDAASRLTKHPIFLDEIDEYKEAKSWLRRNARYVLDEEDQKQLDMAFRALGSGTGRLSSKHLADMARHIEGYYDEYGRGDGRKLSAAQQEAIRKEQDSENADRANSPFNTLTLLNSAERPNQVYTKAFYTLSVGDLKKNPDFIRLVEGVNKILRKHYDAANKRITWANVTEAEYTELKSLYKQIAAIKDLQKVDPKKAKYIEWADGTHAYELARRAAELGGTINMELWEAVNTETIIDDEGNEVKIPNRFIYSYQKPSEEGMNVKTKKGRCIYIDEGKTKAIEIIANNTISEPTSYYYQELERRANQSKEGIVDADGRTFEKWYEDNHTYDPITGSYQPIKCWMQYTLFGGKGHWEASFNQEHTVPKKEFINPNHKEGLTLGTNYKKGSGYDNTVAQNSYEEKIGLYIKELLISLSSNNANAKRFFEQGNLPVQMTDAEKDLQYYLKELAKLSGWVETPDGYGPFKKNIDYSSDKIPEMPMTQRLRSKSLDDLKLQEPNREHYDSNEAYNKAVAEYEDAKKKLKEENDEFHRLMHDKDWVNVISNFILKAEHYNAIQENKYMLYYGQQMLKSVRNYIDYTGNPNLPKGDKRAPSTVKGYETQPAAREYEQYTNWMRRLILNQWKKPNGRYSKVANILQSITSANFMMMNVRGGIANITLGETQIQMEAFAREYFTWKQYLEGKGIWLSNVANFIVNRHNETSTTVADAVIKFMNVVDFDEIRGVPKIDVDPSTYLTRLRNFMFSPQTIGENFMQNSVLFTILMSHKLVKNDAKVENGRTSYVAMSRAEFIRNAHEEALLEVLDEKQKAEYKNKVTNAKKDPNTLRDYAQFKVNFTTEFAMGLDKAQQDKFKELKDKKIKEAIKAYEEAPDIWSQLDLKDGRLGFKDGSILQELDVKDKNDISEAYQILAGLKGRVISVNKKIHGVYDKMGAAQIENNWWGSLVMQYHKHIVPGVLKRWRIHGYYNEERGTIERGCHIALFDFLAIPFRKHASELDINEAQTTTLEGIQETFKDAVDFLFNIGHYYSLLAPDEQANIRRNLGDLVGVLSALCFAIALRALWDDDDEDGRLYNLALYECDRLASETMQFNPLGAFTEAKKLWSNPVAVQSIVNDVMSSIGIITQMIMEGDEFDPYYASGKYAGEHKLAVRLRRRIPIWRGIDTIINIADDNHYYKLGDNMLSIVPVKRIADYFSN